MSLHIAFQMDPLERLHHPTDSTLALAAAAAGRGHRLFHYAPGDLHLELNGSSKHITARGHALNVKRGAENTYALGQEETHALKSFDVILLRQDPPFDLAYITTTHILEQAGTLVVNDPAGVRNAPEKLLITHFPQLMPPTVITRDRKAVQQFREAQGDIIVKPLFGWAGHGIFHIKPGDDNLPALLEIMDSIGNEPWVIQKYLPEIKDGDKRIIILNGEPVGCFRRIPAQGDVRGNMRVGARAEACSLTARDREICKTLAPELQKRGLYFAGLDMIGDYVTEINVTSPTGIVTADQLEGRKGKDSIAELFWDFVEKEVR